MGGTTPLRVKDVLPFCGPPLLSHDMLPLFSVILVKACYAACPHCLTSWAVEAGGRAVRAGGILPACLHALSLL